MTQCICGSGKNIQDCCEAIITTEKKAQNPEELMRSRYYAYVKGNGKYLAASATNFFQEDIELIEEFSKSVTWLKLNILHVENDSVEFKAYYRDSEGIKVLHEKSFFKQIEGEWKYSDGTLYNTSVQRNESCPCGSGKKYKKCCGAKS